MKPKGSKPIEGPPADEVSAIAACQKGDRNAYELIVRRYVTRAIGAARAILGDGALAEDAAQEAFVRAYRAIQRFELSEPFYPWLYRILKNVCLTTLKKRRRVDAVSIDAENAPPLSAAPVDPSARASREELRLALDGVMTQLSEPHREILHLAHYEELSYKQIAACLSIPLGTVMSRLWSARQALRKKLEPLVSDHE